MTCPGMNLIGRKGANAVDLYITSTSRHERDNYNMKELIQQLLVLFMYQKDSSMDN